ncbi:substrate-binding periplasmic protein [Pannonibacter tanglangensis]|uniref:Transporter substrate-binding domain-containing protein n=1 Tax=Pannonibacter tanglangensis TaxID=2750084 RepID=A0ABW9ZFE8_9HYPH|nr:transporter substrate-binding domain-containing protein [Pannonibacter sp. XCT-34]NBN63575.1 transporter substrate-binding domain-containing protein [Pannonibacter sp. XCT-34]
MKKILLSAIALVCFMGHSNAAEITLTTEDYKPYNFMEGDKIVGIGADQVFELMKRAGVPYKAEMMQWSRAIGLAEKDPNTCVFTASHSAERDKRFTWVEPLFVDRTILIRKAGSSVAPKTVDEAKTFRVGTQAKDYTEDLLKTAGFPTIDPANNLEQTLKKLEAGRVDLVAVSGSFYENLKKTGAAVEEAFVINETTLSMACNLNTDPATLEKMRAALKSMIDDGTQAAILAKYQ